MREEVASSGTVCLGWIGRLDLPRSVSDVLCALLDEIQSVLTVDLVGVYLYGSALGSDFEPSRSDIDLLVAVASDIDDRQLEGLRAMHDQFSLAHSEWKDRVDVAYLSTAALRTFKEHESPIVVISPGEPINRKTTSPGWLMNWHVARNHGVALVGPQPSEVIAATTDEDFVLAVRTHLCEIAARTKVSSSTAVLSYSVVTACRGLFTLATGRQASKSAAAAWAERVHPSWSDVIRSLPLGCSAAKESLPCADTEEMRAIEFVQFAAREATRGSAAPRS